MSERIKRAISTAAIYDPHTIGLLGRSMSNFAAIAEQAGIKYLELHSARFPLTGNIEPNHYLATKILSEHQAFENPKFTNSFRANLMNYAVKALLPEHDRSLQILADLNKNIGKKPIVAYHDADTEKYKNDFTEITLQLKRNAMEAWGTSCVDSFVDCALEKGFDGITIDPAHFFEARWHFKNLGSLETATTRLKERGMLRRAHLTLARVDSYPYSKPAQIDWAKDLYWGKKDGQAGNYLSLLRELEVESIVYELQFTGITHIDDSLPKIQNLKHLKDIVKTRKFPKAFWTEQDTINVLEKINGTVDSILDVPPMV